MDRTVLVIGLGGVGGYALHLLARYPGIELVGADLREEFARSKVSNAYYDVFFQAGAVRHPRIRHQGMDLNDIQGTASLLRKLGPDVILNQTTLQSWWIVHQIPEQVRRRIYYTYPGAGTGPWAPTNLVLTYKLMQAIDLAGIETHVVNGAHPDVVNPVLAKVGLAPTVGMGNSALLEPMIIRIVSDRLQVPANDVSISLVGHHSMFPPITETGTARNVPYHLNIRVFDKDVTDQFDIERDIWPRVPALNVAVDPLQGSQQEWIASCAVRNVLAILFDTGEIVHAPGPEGLPGGYPVRLSASGAEVVVPDGLTREEMIRLNEEGQRLEGVECITDDGTLVITDHSAQILREELGYECKELRLEEAEKKARELLASQKKLVEEYR
jgi:hypothetical protein